MTKIKIISIGLIVSIFFTSCGAKKTTKTTSYPKESKKEADKNISKPDTKEVAVVSTSKKSLSTLEYIDLYSNIAVAQMIEYDIPASITLAQGILESSSGNSDLTKKSNNHFGIKCHKNWNGGRTYYDDDEKGECFRVYDNPIYSYNDHSRFLTQRTRYSALFELGKGDYKAWAEGLKKAGYATDSKYPQKLINIIKKYKLYKYDEMILGEDFMNSSTKADSYIVQKGDGLYGISKKFNISVNDLKKINQLKTNDIFVGQELLIKLVDVVVVDSVDSIVNQNNQDNKRSDKEEVVKDTIPPSKPIELPKTPKKDAFIVDANKYHIVQQGETLYQIAYKYELEIPKIRKWNGIKKDEISIGEKIYIKEPKITNTPKTKTVIAPIVKNDFHEVRKGDTLYSIAIKNGISVAKLKSLNNLKSNTISIGERLMVK